MREVFSDFMRFDRLPDGRIRIPLGTADVADDLKGLHEGERVRVCYPGNLEAEGVVDSESWQGTRYWYAVLESEQAIRDIHPETLAHAGEAASGAKPA